MTSVLDLVVMKKCKKCKGPTKGYKCIIEHFFSIPSVIKNEIQIEEALLFNTS